jgi:hypothetical protein
VTLNLTLHYDRMMLLLDPTPYDPARQRPPNNLEAPGMPTKNRARRDGLPRISPEIDGRTAAP